MSANDIIAQVEKRYPGAEDDGEKYIAECEFTCGWAFGPTLKGVAFAEAAKHDPQCLYGGPVVRNVKQPAPQWTNDPLMLGHGL